MLFDMSQNYQTRKVTGWRTRVYEESERAREALREETDVQSFQHRGRDKPRDSKLVHGHARWFGLMHLRPQQLVDQVRQLRRERQRIQYQSMTTDQRKKYNEYHASRRPLWSPEQRARYAAKRQAWAELNRDKVRASKDAYEARNREALNQQRAIYAQLLRLAGLDAKSESARLRDAIYKQLRSLSMTDEERRLEAQRFAQYYQRRKHH